MPPEPIDDSLIALWRELGPALVLYARTWAGTGEAEDVVQTVFAKLLGSQRVPSDVRPWLFRCVRNEAISWRRTCLRRVRRERAVVDRPPLQPGVGDTLDAAAASQALQRLPALQQEIVVLRIWSGLTLAQAATVMRLPVSTLHDHYQRALLNLRQELEPTWSTIKRS